MWLSIGSQTKNHRHPSIIPPSRAATRLPGEAQRRRAIVCISAAEPIQGDCLVTADEPNRPSIGVWPYVRPPGDHLHSGLITQGPVTHAQLQDIRPLHVGDSLRCWALTLHNIRIGQRAASRSRGQAPEEAERGLLGVMTAAAIQPDSGSDESVATSPGPRVRRGIPHDPHDVDRDGRALVEFIMDDQLNHIGSPACLESSAAAG